MSVVVRYRLSSVQKYALEKEKAKVVRGLPSEVTVHYTTKTVLADYQSDLENDSLSYKINYRSRVHFGEVHSILMPRLIRRQ